MGIVSIPQPEYGMKIEDLIDIVARQSKMLEFLVNGRIDSANVREIAGFNVSPTTFKHKSGIVGMSSAGSLGSSVRFWAGNADPNFAPFRVTQDGTMYATNGNFTGTITGSTVTGGTFRTAMPGNKRIEITGGVLKGYFSDDLLHGLVFNPNSPTNFFDMFLYHDGVQLLEFYDEGSSIKLRPGSGTSIWTLGKVGGTTYLDGQWIFNPTASLNLGPNTATGRVQYANQADSALSSSTANSVDWANVTNHPNPVTLPVVDGIAAIGSSGKYAYSDHVHPTDTTRAPTASPALNGIPTAPTAAIGTSTAQLATTAFVNPTSSLTANGHYKLPCGMIEQWGVTADIVVAAGASVNQTFTFPIPFPTNCLQVVATLDVTGASANGSYCNKYSQTTTNVGVVIVNTTAVSQTYRVSVMAKGI